MATDVGAQDAEGNSNAMPTSELATEFIVTRDAIDPRTDEDAAMAHEQWGPFSYGDAQHVRSWRMNDESEWLFKAQFADKTTLQRAVAIKLAAQDASGEDAPASIEVAGLRWSIKEVSA